MFWLLLACSDPPPPPLAPEVHSWQEEAKLVSDGLHEAEALAVEGQRAAARTLAERVYTERWEPRLERAHREIDGPAAATATEYAWGELFLAIDQGKGKAALAPHLARLDDLTIRLGEAAARRWPPPPGVDVPPPLPEIDGTSKPLTPSIPPAWEAEPAE